MTAPNVAVVSFGSNVKPAENLERAREILETEHTLLDSSDFQWTDPVGIKEQPDFLNGVFLMSTDMQEDDFRHYLKGIEDRLGRDRTAPKAGPRTADLDLVVWNGRVVHQDFHEAEYIQHPLQEILSRNGITPA